MGQISHASPAIRLGYGNAVQPQRAHLFPQIFGKAVQTVDFGGARRNLFCGKPLDGFAKRVNFLTKIEIHHCVKHEMPPITYALSALMWPTDVWLPDCGSLSNPDRVIVLPAFVKAGIPRCHQQPCA